MNLQEVPATAAKGALSLVLIPGRIALGAIDRAVGITRSGDTRSDEDETPVPPAGKPAQGKPVTAAERAPAAERPEVVAEQTDGLEEVGLRPAHP